MKGKIVAENDSTITAAADEVPSCRRDGVHRPDDLPEEGNRCKDCGQRITWMAPGIYDWESCEEVDRAKPRARFPAQRVNVISIEALNEADFGGRDLSYGTSPEAQVQDNTRRAGFTVPALRAFSDTVRLHGEDVDTVISDLLGDLLHLCDALGHDFDALLERGCSHYEAEVEG